MTQAIAASKDAGGHTPGWLEQEGRRVWATLSLALKVFARIGGAESAAAFAHYAFFALFPLILLFVTIASVFVDRNRAATAIIGYVETLVPIGGEKQRYIFDTIAGVVEARRQAGVVSFLMLAWAAKGFFATLIHAANRAWDEEPYSWWRLPLKSLGFLAISLSAVIVGIAAPVLAKLAQEDVLPIDAVGYWTHASVRLFIALSVLFASLSLLYKLAPRRPTRFAEVWVAAAFATALLKAAEVLFVIYLKHFATLNAVYGVFGGVMALLLWIDLSGCIVILGACLSAAQAEWLSGAGRTNPASAGPLLARHP
jgi:Ca2+-transporting ATPase